MNELNYSSYFQEFQSGLDRVYLLPAQALSIQRREERRVQKHLSRSRKQGVAATLTLEEWLAILDAHDWKCAYCEGPFESVEHVIPLHFGGGTTAENCVPACIACNRLRDWVFRGIAGLAQARELGQMDVIADLLVLEPVLDISY